MGALKEPLGCISKGRAMLSTFYGARSARYLLRWGFDIKAQREPAQTHGHDNAYDQRGDIAHDAAHNEAHIACRSGDGGDGIKVSTLENARNHAHKAVAQHAAAHRGEKPIMMHTAGAKP